MGAEFLELVKRSLSAVLLPGRGKEVCRCVSYPRMKVVASYNIYTESVDRGFNFVRDPTDLKYN